MDILYYLRRFPKLSESFILNEIYALRERGHNVAVFALNRSDCQIVHSELADLDIPVAYGSCSGYKDILDVLSVSSITSSHLHAISHRIPVKLNMANIFWSQQCIEFVDELGWGVDHVHTHFAIPHMYGCLGVAAHYDVPFTITTHAHDLYRKPIGEYTGELLASADRVITISEYNKRHIRETLGVDSPIDIVRAGIRTDKFSPSETVEPRRVLTVARLQEKKGLRYAVEAIALVAQEIPNIDYHIVGSGPEEEELRRLVDERDIEGNVTFLNNVSDDRLITEYDRARCFLLPSVIAQSGGRDGIPVALMEAMAMETPPVSTTVSGIPELVDHRENGILVPPRDTGALAEAIRDLLMNEPTRNTYPRRAREKVVQEFNVRDEVDSLLETFGRAKSVDQRSSPTLEVAPSAVEKT